MRTDVKRSKIIKIKKQPLQCVDIGLQGLKIIALIVTILFLPFLLQKADAEAVIYKDKLGRTVSIPLPVKRAVFFSDL